jgi:hypothetical protein
MSVSDRPISATYDETGDVDTLYGVPFQYVAASQIVVTRIEDGERTILFGYAVTGDGRASPPTGAVQLASSVDGATLEIRRVTPRTQPVIFTDREDFPADLYQDQQDRVVMALQEQDEELGRALRVPLGEEGVELPAAADREGKFLVGTVDGGFAAVAISDVDGVDTLGALAEQGDALVSVDTGIVDGDLLTLREYLGHQRLNLIDGVPRAERAAIEAGTTSYDASAALGNLRESYPGRRIFVQSGTFLLNHDEISSGFELEGECRETSIIRPYSKTGHLFTADSGDDATFIEHIRLFNLTLHGWLSLTDTYLEHCHLINWSGVDGGWIEYCTLIAPRGDGVYWGSGAVGSGPGATERHNKRMHLLHCLVDGELRDNRAGISVIDADGFEIAHSTFTRLTRSNQPGAINLEPDPNAWHVVAGGRIHDNTLIANGGNAGQINITVPSAAPVPVDVDIRRNRLFDYVGTGAAIRVACNRTGTDDAVGFPDADDVNSKIVIAGNHGNGGIFPFAFFGVKGVRVEPDNLMENFTKSSLIGFTDAGTGVRDVRFAPGLRGCGTAAGEVGAVVSNSYGVTIGAAFDECSEANSSGCAVKLQAGATSKKLIFDGMTIVPRSGQTAATLSTSHTQTPASCRIRDNCDFGGLPHDLTAAAPGQQLQGAKTWDAGSVTGAAPATTTVTVTGAALGDYVLAVSLSIDIGGLKLEGAVTAANTVTVILSNPDSDLAGVDLGSATLTALVMKKLA